MRAVLGTAPKLRTKSAEIVREIFRPILRGYFAVFALYYSIILSTNLFYFEGTERVLMASLSAAAAIVGIVGLWLLRRPLPLLPTELLLTAMNVLAVCNVYNALDIQFSIEKLSYFVIMAMLFALASISFRQSLFSIFFAMLALVSFMPRLDQGAFDIYLFLTFGTAISSLAIAYFLRKAITRIAGSKVEAEIQLSDAKLLGEDLRRQSLSDSLTKLPNRRAFFRFLQEAMQEETSDQQRSSAQDNLWLILVDLDGFKAVNDIHGHLVGDRLLKEVSKRLELGAGENAHVCRMGGDEFNIILTRQYSQHEVQMHCDKLLALVAQPYVIDGRNVKISGSAGCRKINLAVSARSQINEADYALMTAKRQGKNRAVIFNQKHAEQASAYYAIEDALRGADLDKEIELMFQPQVDLRSHDITRAEVLARWSSPKVGAIGPERFIKIAEEGGLITEITLKVVEKAFTQMNSWPAAIPLSINLSCHDLISDPTIDHIIQMAQDWEIDTALVEFEVTETAMMADLEKASANLRRLCSAGYTIALDDFGTGYSNFSYLRALPIEKLKVDRSFVANSGDPMTERMLSSLAGMAHTLGVHCLLEGVETEVDLLMAKRAGADSVQGYLFGEPMSSADLVALLEDRNAAKNAADSKGFASQPELPENAIPVQ